jgi:hypothetical protein
LVDLEAEIGEVAWVGRPAKDFVDDGEKVSEGADGRQRRSLGVSVSASTDSDQESDLDGLKGDAAVEELLGDSAVGRERAVGCRVRQPTVEREQMAQVVVAIVSHGERVLRRSLASASLSRRR